MLRLNEVNKKLGQFALIDINIHIHEGEYYVLLGRSGSGKTQLLEVIAGLNVADSGEIWLDKEEITRTKIQNRKIGLVFQDYAIFPNMTVFGNIAYPLHSKHIERKIIDQMVGNIASELNISHLLSRYTHKLSGGELQRVALARTLVTSPKLLLLDEPMSSIDASLKDDIKRVLRMLNRKGLTIIHVTHDYREAVSLASRVGVIHNGRLIQEGKPDEVFRRPVNKFVARYAGVRNFFRAKFIKENGSWKAICRDKMILSISDNIYPSEGLLIIRSEDIQIHNQKPVCPHGNIFKGTVNEITPSDYGMEVTIDAGERFFVDVATENFNKQKIVEQANVWITFSPGSLIPLEGTN
jgi:molybdate/tungstate transport system ATP-binding protein